MRKLTPSDQEKIGLLFHIPGLSKPCGRGFPCHVDNVLGACKGELAGYDGAKPAADVKVPVTRGKFRLFVIT